MSTLERPPILPSVLPSFTLHDVSISQQVWPSNTNNNLIPKWSHVMFSPSWYKFSVALLIERIQRQLNLPVTPLKSHYHLVRATGDTLTTLGTIQVNVVLDSKICPTLVIVVSSVAHPLILGLYFFKVAQSKIDFNTNNVEIGWKIHPVDDHCITNSTSTITIPISDIYQPCRLLLNKKGC